MVQEGKLGVFQSTAFKAAAAAATAAATTSTTAATTAYMCLVAATDRVRMSISHLAALRMRRECTLVGINSLNSILGIPANSTGWKGVPVRESGL